MTATEASLDELGPVDYVVVEFPAGATNFTGEMVEELLALVDSGTIRVIDVLILTKNDDGSVDAAELADLEGLGELEALEAQLAELLAQEDIVHLAAAMDPGSTAGVLIWENLGPPLVGARRSGGQLIANGRIPIRHHRRPRGDDATDTEEYDHATQTSPSRKKRRHRRPRRQDRRSSPPPFDRLLPGVGGGGGRGCFGRRRRRIESVTAPPETAVPSCRAPRGRPVRVTDRVAGQRPRTRRPAVSPTGRLRRPRRNRAT